MEWRICQSDRAICRRASSICSYSMQDMNWNDSEWLDEWTSHLRNGESYLISAVVVLSCHIQRYEETPEIVLVNRGVVCISAAQHESKDTMSIDLWNKLHISLLIGLEIEARWTWCLWQANARPLIAQWFTKTNPSTLWIGKQMQAKSCAIHNWFLPWEME